eukprot:UN00365
MSGHDYQHFTKKELIDDLINNNFTDIKFSYIDDSFVITGDSEIQSLIKGIRHICNLFGLVKIIPADDSNDSWLKVVSQLEHYFINR